MVNDDLMRYFQRHLVPMLLTFEDRGKPEKYVITAFVMLVSDVWFLITAGHCIRDISKRLQMSDAKTFRCELMDFFGTGAKYTQAIPFTDDLIGSTSFWGEYPFDYGVIPLRPYYVHLLLANKIVPLSEEVWKKQPSNVASYYLLGIPAELVQYVPERLHLGFLLIPVQPLDEKPQAFEDTDSPMFYGRVVLDATIGSIQGMSGGPIFAFQKDENGRLRYFLTALQSRWNPNSGEIAACPTSVLGDFLDNLINGLN